MNSPIHRQYINRHRISSWLAVLLAAAILLSACTAPTATPATATPPLATPTVEPIDVSLLYNTLWVLVGYGDPANPTVVGEGAKVTIEFTPEGQAAGYAGCNNYGGTYTAQPSGEFTMQPVSTTRMICPQGMDVETAYLTALQNIESFGFSTDGRLELIYKNAAGDEQKLIYTSGQETLTDNLWVLLSYGDPKSPQEVPASSLLTANFSADGIMSGFSGCNSFSTSYTLENEKMTLGPVAATLMACPTGMEQEQAYLAALGTVQTYEIKGSFLQIIYNNGAEVLNYTSAKLPFEHTLWTLAALNGEPVSAETQVTATFIPGETAGSGIVSGSSGCNTYTTGYTLDGANITVSAVAGTMMACPTGMEAEQAYLQALQTAQSYEIFGDRMVLRTAAGSLTFAANRTPLTGALWSLVALGDIKEPQPPVRGSNFTAQFMHIADAPTGMLTGTTGCNEYATAYVASVDEIKINPALYTDKGSCAPGLVDQEKLFFLALNDATRYYIIGNTLIMPYDNDRQALVFMGTQLGVAERAPLSELNNTTWYLWYLNSQPVASGTTISAVFTINSDGGSGNMQGLAGCNNYVATFGENMGMQTSLNSRQTCVKPVGIMDQEASYLEVLARTYGYWLNGDQLILNSGLGVLTYQKMRPPESYDQTHLLVGVRWFLVAYNNTYSVPGAQEPYTQFNENGTLNGYTGCNNLTGNYKTNITQITVSNLAKDQLACPNSALQAQDTAMLDMLNTARSYQLADTSMQIIGDKGVLYYSLNPIHRSEEVTPPIAAFQAPAQATVGKVVTFDGSASSGQVPIVAWEWSYGDGASGTGKVVQHVYNLPGNYSVQLVVTDQLNNKGSKTQNIEVLAVAQPTATPTLAPTPTTPVQPTVAPSPTTAVQPTVAPSPTTAVQPTQGPSPTTPAQPVQPTQAATPTTATEPTLVPTPTVPPPTQAPAPTQPPSVPPQAVIQGPSTGYVGEPLSFDAAGSQAGSSPITTYAWDFGDGSSAGPGPESNVAAIYNHTGVYQVSVVVTDQGGVSSSATLPVSISTRLNTPLVWKVDNLSNKPLLPGTAITLQFIGGQVGGFSGCNTYSGGYTATQNENGSYSLQIQALTTTSMACPEDIMKQESSFLAFLQSSTTAQIQGNVLNLAYPEGTGPADEPYPAGTLILTEVTGSQ